MKIQFTSLNNMKDFAGYLSTALNQLGYGDKAEIVKGFSYNSFTTSSEYLGEFRTVLAELIQSRMKRMKSISVSL